MWKLAPTTRICCVGVHYRNEFEAPSGASLGGASSMRLDLVSRSARPWPSRDYVISVAFLRN